MKYTIRENENQTHTLLRYGESRGTPTNAELEFWFEIERLKEEIQLLSDGVNYRCGVDNKQLPLVSVDRLVNEIEKLKGDVKRLSDCLVHQREERPKCAKCRGTGSVFTHYAGHIDCPSCDGKGC